MVSFISCIKNELGEVVVYCSDNTHEENMKILENHQEWYLSCETVENDCY